MDSTTNKVHIISTSREPFFDRADAGRLLSRELDRFTDAGALILGIPRGGVVVAAEVARLLGADLDVILSRKLSAPDEPELAIGAVAESGDCVIQEQVASTLRISPSYLTEEQERQKAEIARRSASFRSVKQKIPLTNRPVIVVDDGIATGATMQAALWSARREHPRELLAAVPVGSDSALDRIAPYADEVICLRCPLFFYAVGEFYTHFDQTSDQEVLAILKEF